MSYLPALRSRWTTETVPVIVAALKASKLQFDAIAFTGVSGALIAPIVAFQMGVDLIVVRKDIEGSHSKSLVEGAWQASKILIIDDFVATGDTVMRIANMLREHRPLASVVGVYEYNYWVNECYHDDSIPVDPSAGKLTFTAGPQTMTASVSVCFLDDQELVCRPNEHLSLFDRVLTKESVPEGAQALSHPTSKTAAVTLEASANSRSVVELASKPGKSSVFNCAMSSLTSADELVGLPSKSKLIKDYSALVMRMENQDQNWDKRPTFILESFVAFPFGDK
jgi:hypothetical protein